MKVEERLKAQMPQNELASVGMMCTYCDLGPCVINPFDEQPQVGACGIDAEAMNYVNLGVKVIKGLNDYQVPSRLSISLDRMLGHTHSAEIGARELLAASKDVLKASQELASAWHRDGRTPHEIEHGIGVLEKDSVNLVLTVYSPEMIKTARSQKYRTMARENDARGINVVGALCGGAEASYNYEIPLLGSTSELEEAADMIDFVYRGGDAAEACEKAIENFSKRDKATFRHFTPKRYTIGYDIDKEKINEAVDRGLIKGVVVLMGCEAGKTTWDTEEIVRELAENDFMVINLSCILKETAYGVKGCVMMEEYNIPCVINGGCCEPGKILGLKKLTVLVPGWREPRLLTAAFGCAAQNIPVIMGTAPFVIPQVRVQLAEAGVQIETDSSKVVELLR